MEMEKNKHQSMQSLTDWSKWLISINFLSATGCIIALETSSPPSNVGIFFFAAILLFSLSVICSTLFTLMLAIQDLPKSELDSRQFTWLAMLQWILFTLGLLCVLIWIGFLTKVF
ncbi:MAG: hypothetical protein ABIN89_20155 [Chitinophagaceae bacterium]